LIKNFFKVKSKRYRFKWDEKRNWFGYSDLGADWSSIGQFLGRNLDFIAGDAAEIVVRTTNKYGRYATIGVFGVMLWLNSEMMDARLTDADVIEFIPHFIVDGMNEKGVAIEFNVVNTLDTGAGFTLHTNPGKKEVSQICTFPTMKKEFILIIRL